MEQLKEAIKVSIVVAVYNAESFLSKCIESLLKQSYRNIEILCVNDCSTDNSLQVLNSYAAQDSRVIVINHEENQRGGGAYDTGILNATGEYICIVDNDDWLREDAIEKLLSASNNGQYDIVGPAHYSVFGDEIESVGNAFIVSTDKNQIITSALLNGFRMIGNLIRREIFIKNDLFYPRKAIYADIPVVYSILFSANSIKGIDEPLYYYSHVPTSITARPSLQKVKDRMNGTDLFIENLKKRGFYTKEYKELIDYKYLTYSAYTLIMICKLGWKESLPLMRTLKERIKLYMPNSLVKQSSRRNRFILNAPDVAHLIGFLLVRIKKDKR